VAKAVIAIAGSSGKRLLRLEVRNAQTPIERKPPWIKVRARMGPEYTQLKGLVRRRVCTQSAKRRLSQHLSNAGRTGKPPS
jgi:hypothetical protein